MIRAKETDEYEVYMITLTPTSDTPTDTLKGSTAAGNNSYEYKGTETVVWADTQEDLDASGLGTYTSISGAFTYSIGGEPIVPGVEIYRKQAMKVTYYVRAKVTEDSLTVTTSIRRPIRSSIPTILLLRREHTLTRISA